MVSLQREQAYTKKEAIVIAISVIVVFASAEVGLGLYYPTSTATATNVIYAQSTSVLAANNH